MCSEQLSLKTRMEEVVFRCSQTMEHRNRELLFGKFPRITPDWRENCGKLGGISAQISRLRMACSRSSSANAAAPSAMIVRSSWCRSRQFGTASRYARRRRTSATRYSRRTSISWRRSWSIEDLGRRLAVAMSQIDFTSTARRGKTDHYATGDSAAGMTAVRLALAFRHRHMAPHLAINVRLSPVSAEFLAIAALMAISRRRSGLSRSDRSFARAAAASFFSFFSFAIYKLC